MRKTFRMSMVIFLLVFVLSAPADAAISVTGKPGVDAAQLVMVENTVGLFNEILKSEMDVTLDDNITVIICPDRNSYRQLLQEEFGLNTGLAAQIANTTSGFSPGGKNAVAVQLDPTSGYSTKYRIYNTVAHELTHKLQAQLAKGKSGRSYYWIREGMADYIGATVASRVGFESLEKWKLDRVNALRKATQHVPAQDIMHLTLQQWEQYIEDKLYPYEVSDLMIFYLLQQSAGNYQSLAGYFIDLGKGIENEECFKQRFGIEGQSLVAGFTTWLQDANFKPAELDIIQEGVGEPVWAVDFKQGANLTRRMFSEEWGQDLKNSIRIVLCSDKKAYANALIKEFGITAQEAEVRARNSVWWYSNSTTVYDMGSLSTPRQRIFEIANNLIRRLEHETALQKDLEQLTWLIYGSGDVVSAAIVAKAGLGTSDQYRSGWIAEVKKAKVFPRLSEMAARGDWAAAKERYGIGVTSRTAAIAAMLLADRFGLKSFFSWCQAVKETGSASAGFEKVYGMSVAAFELEFARYLSQH